MLVSNGGRVELEPNLGEMPKTKSAADMARAGAWKRFTGTLSTGAAGSRRELRNGAATVEATHAAPTSAPRGRRPPPDGATSGEPRELCEQPGGRLESLGRRGRRVDEELRLLAAGRGFLEALGGESGGGGVRGGQAPRPPHVTWTIPELASCSARSRCVLSFNTTDD